MKFPVSANTGRLWTKRRSLGYIRNRSFASYFIPPDMSVSPRHESIPVCVRKPLGRPASADTVKDFKVLPQSTFGGPAPEADIPVTTLDPSPASLRIDVLSHGADERHIEEGQEGRIGEHASVNVFEEFLSPFRVQRLSRSVSRMAALPAHRLDELLRWNWTPRASAISARAA